MSRILNSNDFLIKFREAKHNYNEIFGPHVSKIRKKYTQENTGEIIPDVDESLEAHLRTYLINALLYSLNWRLNSKPEEGLPNIVAEAPIRSMDRDTIRFLDYFGVDTTKNNKPLIIVETKRPKSKLPTHNYSVLDEQLEEYSLIESYKYQSLIFQGIRGSDIGQEWNEWLATLEDYVKSVRGCSGHSPRRLIITNGHWLVLFTDPEDSFLSSDNKDKLKILVYKDREDIEKRYDELFRYLDYFRVIDSADALVSSEIAFYISPDIIDYAMFGLLLLYIEEPGIYNSSPLIKVSPVVLIYSKHGSWLRIESRKEEELPHLYEKLKNHLDNIDRIAKYMVEEIEARLRIKLRFNSLVEHFTDNKEVNQLLLPVKEISYSENVRSRKYILITGKNTYFVHDNHPVSNCLYHLWENSNLEQSASTTYPIGKRSIEYRSFFRDGELHHCTHYSVRMIKASQVTSDNYMRCVPGIEKEQGAFCRIWSFENHLCCKMCNFKEICVQAEVFVLPCEILL